MRTALHISLTLALAASLPVLVWIGFLGRYAG